MNSYMISTPVIPLSYSYCPMGGYVSIAQEVPPSPKHTSERKTTKRPHFTHSQSEHHIVKTLLGHLKSIIVIPDIILSIKLISNIAEGNKESDPHILKNYRHSNYFPVQHGRYWGRIIKLKSSASVRVP